ncbi:MAG TPA: prenyltransferase/squalene oxidase repeat-containing protein [Phycisphaerales bacterium]|nr:prenyltransferase/squalene oxidase repeat-containing protein [Phycisphaerales bacterium]
MNPSRFKFLTWSLLGVALLLSISAFALTSQEATAPPPTAPDSAPPAEAEPHDEPGANPANAPADNTVEPPHSESSAENNPLQNEITPELTAQVKKGLEYLRNQQNTDGSFGRGRYGKHVGIAGLCALAFMADGSTPTRGPYSAEISHALDYVLANADETGLLSTEDTNGPMYSHGFAALFLGEVYGMVPNDHRLRDALVKAVALIVGTQNEEGGWRYNPVPYDADVSVTICQVMALRSARNAGISVPKTTIDRAVRYIRNCQNPDGGFKYMLQTGGSAWPRTAAGVASLYYAGIYEDDSIDRGIRYLMTNAFPGSNTIGQAHYYYGHYYAVQAMYLSGGDNWRKWWPAVRSELLSRQSQSGGWLDQNTGGMDATSMALIVLQMPKRYLPIFQR